MNLAKLVQMSIECWGAFLSVIGIIFVRRTQSIDKNKSDRLLAFMLTSAVLMISDALAIGFRGDTSTLGYYMVRISNLFMYISSYFMILCGAFYFTYIIEKRSAIKMAIWRQVESVITLVALTLLAINLFYPFLYDFDNLNQYFRSNYCWILTSLQALGILIMIVIWINHFKELKNLELYALAAGMFLTGFSLIIQLVFYGFSLTIISITVTVALTFFSYLADYINYLVEKEREREQWINHEQIRLLHNQIKPHFIYNTLTSVYYAVEHDPELAKDMIKNLSGYLRGSLDVLDETECIDVSQEISTVEYYLSLEMQRFEQQIKVEFDIKDTDFSVPAFCIQTIVENAVKYGIRRNDPPEGTIWIKTFMENDTHVITIEDDGSGFEMDRIYDDDSKHIGLRNTKKRLELMCNGTLDVNSIVGKGTYITIKIPDTEAVND